MLAASLPAAADKAAGGASAVVKTDDAADKLSAHDLDLLAKARTAHEKRVTLIIATASGKADEVTASVKAMGGWVASRNDKIGYVRAEVPTAKVERAAALRDVAAVDLDEVLRAPQPRRRRRGRRGRLRSSRRRARQTPNSNPYMPTNETGAVAFKKAHRTWTGAGSPSASSTPGSISTTRRSRRRAPANARSSTGSPPPTRLEGDATLAARWLAGHRAAGRRSTTGDTARLDRCPRVTYGISTLLASRSTAGSELSGDVNRDGDTTDRFGVLYDPVTNDVWVDSDEDNDFTDERADAPATRGAFQVGHFGTDNPDDRR